MKMTGNTVLVTGGTSGIGRGLAEALHDRGNVVIVTGRRRELLESVAARRPGITGIVMDIDDPASITRAAGEVDRRFPDLDMLVANAGISAPEDLTSGGWDASVAEALIATNITGTVKTIAAFLPALKRQTDSTLLVTGSKLAFVPKAGFPTYCATKAFIHSWLQSLRFQLRDASVEVLELLPPYVATELLGPSQAKDPYALPLDAFLAEAMKLLEENDHPDGEILVERARADRAAEREGRYDAAFAAANPR